MSKSMLMGLILLLSFEVQAQVFAPVGNYKVKYPSSIANFFTDTLTNKLFYYNPPSGMNGDSVLSGTEPFAIWDGQVWDSMPGISHRMEKFNEVGGMCYFKGNLYALGPFGHSPYPWYNMMYWKDNDWQYVDDPDSVSSNNVLVRGCFSTDSMLYFYGAFDSIEGVTSSNIIAFDGTNYHSFGTMPPSGNIYQATIYQGQLYAGGNLLYPPNDYRDDLVKWNGTSWEAVGNFNLDPNALGNSTVVFCMKEFQGKLVVGGHLTMGANGADGCAAWDGTTWTPMNVTGLPSITIRALEVYKGDLYGLTGHMLVKWNGTSWQVAGEFLGTSNTPMYMAVWNDELYIGGFFLSQNYQSVFKYNNTVGITEPLSAQVAKVYPNPASEYLQIEVTQTLVNQGKYTIYDATGKIMQQQAISKEKERLDIHAYPQGMYYLLIESGGRRLSSSFIKK